MTKKIRSIPMKFNFVAFGNALLSHMAENGLQNRDLAILADTSSSVISRYTNAALDNAEIRTILKLCNALDIDPRQFFELHD